MALCGFSSICQGPTDTIPQCLPTLVYFVSLRTGFAVKVISIFTHFYKRTAKQETLRSQQQIKCFNEASEQNKVTFSAMFLLHKVFYRKHE